MPPEKRKNARGGGQLNKRQKCDQASGPAPKADYVPPKKANTRSAKKDNAAGAQITKPSPPPKLQLRYTPPLTKPHGFPCFSDGDVLIILHSENTRHQLRLHSSKLRTFSPVLDDLLSTRADENIPKKMLGPNLTELAFCLELSGGPESGWGLKRGPLYCEVIPDNYNSILAAPEQVKYAGLGYGYDGSSEPVLASPINGESIISPPQTPITDIKEEDASRRFPNDTSALTFRAPIKDLERAITQEADVPVSHNLRPSEEPSPTGDLKSPLAQEHEGLPPTPMVCTVGDRVIKACSKRYDSPPFDDNQAQEIGQPATTHPNLATELGSTIVIAGAKTISAATAQAADMPQTYTFGSKSCSIDMTQYSESEQIHPDLFTVKGSVLTRDASESRASSKTVELDSETAINPISVSEPSANPEGKEIGSAIRPSMNMSNLGALGGDTTEAVIGQRNLQGINPRAQIGDMVDKTPSVRVDIKPTSDKEFQDDNDCQFILARSMGPSTGAAPIIPKPRYWLTDHRNIEALQSLFRVAYYEAPIISNTDMELALFQIENIIAVATFYRVLQAFVAPVGYALAQHGHSLYQSITLKPVRWLKVAIELKHEIIFQEAVIHLVGKFSGADNFNRELFPGVPGNVIDLVYRKVVDMDRRICKVHGLLISSSIYESEMRVKLEDRWSLETCFVIHTWREWYLYGHAKAHIQNSCPDIQSKLGMLYRKILAGKDGYLPEDKMLECLHSLQLSQLQGGADQNPHPLQWSAAAEDLSLLKSYASRIVQEICCNRSQLNPVEAGFNYLTCTHIDAHEFPWARAPRS
ncbi:hypothetical protein VE03_08867 [Pseudogymnoascus sp. 23342-1-I1]|nr:hypothetical protein VE03_08867 [Pseudogymnoascus sp. 23342-1-I1]